LPNEIIGQYGNLLQIEKGLSDVQTDLRIRPICHRLRHRIEAHICLSFTAYTVYKELERILKQARFALSVEKATEITQNIYELEIILPQSLQPRKIILKTDDLQTGLLQIIQKNI